MYFSIIVDHHFELLEVDCICVLFVMHFKDVVDFFV